MTYFFLLFIAINIVNAISKTCFIRVSWASNHSRPKISFLFRRRTGGTSIDSPRWAEPVTLWVP
jgi:hypothetical protein